MISDDTSNQEIDLEAKQPCMTPPPENQSPIIKDPSQNSGKSSNTIKKDAIPENDSNLSLPNKDSLAHRDDSPTSKKSPNTMENEMIPENNSNASPPNKRDSLTGRDTSPTAETFPNTTETHTIAENNSDVSPPRRDSATNKVISQNPENSPNAIIKDSSSDTNPSKENLQSTAIESLDKTEISNTPSQINPYV